VVGNDEKQTMKIKFFIILAILTISTSVYGDNNDIGTVVTVYIAGNYTDSSGNRIACYWKNGIRTDLTTSEISSFASASVIAIQGADVYAAGF